jgi:aspartyl-tRNA(Asn)/glutamyl-tRNA(Gln) amidotransferase subunit A
MDAVTLAEQIRSTRISPVEVTEAVLAAHGAPATLYTRPLHAQLRNARAEAKRIEADIMAGRAVGPLAGVPVSFQDLVLTKACVPRPVRSRTRISFLKKMTLWSNGYAPGRP